LFRPKFIKKLLNHSRNLVREVMSFWWAISYYPIQPSKCLA